MKRSLLIAAALLMAASAVADGVSPLRARQVAWNAASLFLIENSNDSKSAAEPATVCQMEEVSCELGVGEVYVFNYAAISPEGDSVKGFVVVSGDDIAAPVLAVSDEGTLDAASLNPAARYWLELYGKQIAASRQEGAKATAAVAAKWDGLESGSALKEARNRAEAKGDFYDDNIRQLLGGMVWGQSAPYNNRCPGGSVTGCVATAFGMIMNYWDYPEHGFGQHSYNGADNPAAYPNWSYGTLSVDYENTYYDWENMTDYVYTNSNEVSKAAISTLLYHIGVSLDMRYTPNGSGCWSLPEYATFDTSLHLSPTMGAQYRIPKHFGYKFSYAGLRDSVGDDTLWLQMLYNSLAEGKPIYYAGWAEDDSEAGHSGTSGHGYILDGYFSDITDSNLFHINWGWGGAANGFFKLDAMRPQDNDFTKWHGAIIGIEPDTAYHGYDPAAIAAVEESSLRIVAGQGNLAIETVAGTSVAVYDMMGRCVAHRDKAGEDTWNVRLRPGLYLVQASGQRAKKAVVY